jgi:hypothetical protein
MAMKTAVALAVWLLATLAQPATAFSQTVHVEADVTGGYSTDHVLAAATQVRLFGDVRSGLRIYAEMAWAARKLKEEEGEDAEHENDAFGAAYPYGNRVQAIEVYGERLFRPGRALVGFRAGRYRTPFGIHDRSDYAYTGFLRAPLIRYDGYYALSNNFFEHGAELIAGIPQLYVTTSVGAPADVGSVQRRSGVDSVSRIQGYYGPWIVGASLISTTPYFSARFAKGRSVFTGVDLRFNRGGVQMVGEWLTGRPFVGATTDGWHASVIVHRPEMGPVSAVFRVEALDYEAGPLHVDRAKRQTAGARVLLSPNVSAQINVLHQTGDLSEYATALDVAVTYSIRLR